jgi:hypothetical protein
MEKGLRITPTCANVKTQSISSNKKQPENLVALRAAIDEGLKSGVSQRSVTDILNAKEAQMKQDGRL